jgi:hypothetical protein
MERAMTKTHDIDVGKVPLVISDSGEIRDRGKVRIGEMSPSFPPMRRTPANTSDSGKVSLGAYTPAFPPPRSR